MSVGSKNGSAPREMDVFVTIRHVGVDGNESMWYLQDLS